MNKPQAPQDKDSHSFDINRRGLLKTGVATAVTALGGLGLSACGGGDTTWRPKRTVIVILENKSFQELIGSADMPYLNDLAVNSALMVASYAAPTPYNIVPSGGPYGLATAVSFIHALPARGSQTNYFYQFAGNNQGFLPDWFKQPGSGRLGTAYHDQYGATLSAPATNTEIGLSNELVPASLRPFTTPNLGAALIQAGLSFATFSEGLPHPLFDDKTFTPTGAKDGYARRHNPAINWINFPSLNASVPADKQRFLLPVASNLAMVATTDTNGVKYPGFGWDKDGKTAPFEALPTVSIVVPTNDDNIHTGSKAAADAWLKTYIKPYADWARANDGLLIITTDEDGFTDSSNGSTTVSYDALIKQAIPGTTGSYMYGMDRIATLFHGPANRIKAGSYSQRIDHLNVLATVLGMYGVLDQFKADFEARHTATTDAIRIKEAKSQVANLTPITAMLV